MKSLNDVIDLSKEDLKRLGVIKTKLLNDFYVKEIVDKFQLSDEQFDKFLPALYEYSFESKTCSNCKGLEYCPYSNKGYKAAVIMDKEELGLEYEPCRYQIGVIEKRGPSIPINTMYFPQDFIRNSGDIHITKERKDVLSETTKFLQQYNKGNFMKGLYLYSPYGNGKTYILSYIALKLASKGYNVLMAYFPDLAREIKSSISTGDLEYKIDSLKEVDILMLDDIGGEMPSAWLRDEVLGPILQYRTLSQKPTFFSSNYNLEELLNHLSVNNDKVKGARIIERIKFLSKEMELKGKNYRL